MSKELKPSDIVDRLRKPNGVTDWAVMIEAANLIESLRASKPGTQKNPASQTTVNRRAEKIAKRARFDVESRWDHMRDLSREAWLEWGAAIQRRAVQNGSSNYNAREAIHWFLYEPENPR